MAIPIHNSVTHNLSDFSVPRVPKIGTYSDEPRLIIEEYKDKLYFIYSTSDKDVLCFDLKSNKKHTIFDSGMPEIRTIKVNYVRIGKRLWVSIGDH